MRIRKQASKMLMIPPPPPPPSSSSSSMFNPPPSHELIGSKQTEEKADPTGKESSMEFQIRTKIEVAKNLMRVSVSGVAGSTTKPSKSGLDAETEKGKGKRSSAAVIACRRSDGKGWQCKRAAADGSLLSDHHLSLSRARYSSSSANITVMKAKRAQKKGKEEAKENEAGDGGRFGRRNGGDDKMDGTVVIAVSFGLTSLN